MNKYLQIIFAISFALSSYANSDDKFILPKILSNSKIVLGSQIENAIKQKNSNFELFKNNHFLKTVNESTDNHPMGITADFNDDGFRDIALLGYSKLQKKIIIYVAVSNIRKRAFDIVEVIDFEISENTFKSNPMYLNKAEFDKRETLQIETNGPGDVSVLPFYYSKKTKTFEAFLGKFD